MLSLSSFSQSLTLFVVAVYVGTASTATSQEMLKVMRPGNWSYSNDEISLGNSRHSRVVSYPLWDEDEDENYDRTSNLTSGNGTMTRVSLPDLPCSNNVDCEKWHEPLLVCHMGQCICPQPHCWVYTYETNGWTSRYIFTCDKCGQLGSWCNESFTCDYPGVCYADGYCHCPQGEIIHGICVVTDTSWINMISLAFLGLFVFLAATIGAYHIYKERPWQQPHRWCCGIFPGKGHFSRRRGSCEKTPAYTIQNIYSFQPSMTQRDEIGSERQEHRESHRRSNSRFVGGEDGTGNSSISSLDTTLTDVSSASTINLGAEALVTGKLSEEPLGHEQVFTITLNVPAEQTNYEPASGSSSIHEEPMMPSSCIHERCQLCLPKGLSARPSAGGPADTSSDHTTAPESSSQVTFNLAKFLISDPNTSNPHYESSKL